MEDHRLARDLVGRVGQADLIDDAFPVGLAVRADLDVADVAGVAARRRRAGVVMLVRVEMVTRGLERRRALAVLVNVEAMLSGVAPARSTVTWTPSACWEKATVPEGASPLADFRVALAVTAFSEAAGAVVGAGAGAAGAGLASAGGGGGGSSFLPHAEMTATRARAQTTGSHF